MKRIFTFLVFGAITAMTTQVLAQSPRMTFVEEATQASCPPCATANPPLQALLNDNSDKAIFVAYQVWWPGYDAMYLDNTSEVDVRIGDYYSDINGAPNIVVQGSSGAQATTYLTDALIDDTYEEMSEFDMTLDAVIENGSLNISGDIAATAAASGDLRLRLIITEHLINTEDLIQNGTNGETEFHHVFKSFVNGPAGIDLEDSWMMGDSYTIDESFDLGTLNIYNYSEINVVAIIQNDDDKFVHQAAKADDIDIIVDSDLSAAANSVQDIPAQCSGDITIEPVVKISNTGNNDLTSCTITYNVNGGMDQTFDWEGSLTTFANEDVQLPAISFTTAETNTLNVTVSDPNDGMDELMDDNMTSTEIALSPQAEEWVVLTINTDTYADEIYWEIQDGSGNMVANGGNPNVGLNNVGTGTFPPPADPASYANSTTYTIGIDVEAIDCYTLYFSDYFGDGVAVYGGSFVLEDSQGNLLVDGTGFDGAQMIDQYEAVSTGVSVEDIEASNDFVVLSNPVSNQLDLVVSMSQADNSVIRILDAQGRTLIHEDLGTLSAGEFNLSYDVSAFASGMYYVSLTTGEKVVNQKVIVRK